MSWFYMAMQREPVVMWSCFIGALGVAIPVVVPPIRESFSGTKPVPPPNPHAVAKALTGRQ